MKVFINNNSNSNRNDQNGILRQLVRLINDHYTLDYHWPAKCRTIKEK